MASRTLELILISAQDLKDVNHFAKMEVYAVVSIAGDRRSQQCTPTDRHNGKNPAWNSTLRFSLPATGDLSRHVLHILLCSEHSHGDRDVGEIHIPLGQLLSGPSAGKDPSTIVSYQVRKPSSGESMGVLNLSYKFIDSTPTKFAAYSPSATAYPPPAANYEPPKEYPVYPEATAGYGYSPRPPQVYHGCAQQPQPAYCAYGQPQAVYGYAPAPQPAYCAYGPPQTVYGYAPAPQPAYCAYGPPQTVYGYAPAPQPAYCAYGPPPAVYGYAPAPQQPKMNMFGWMGRVLSNVVGDVVGELAVSGLDLGM